MCPKEERAIALPLDQSTNADPLSYRGFNRQGRLMNDGIFLFSSSSIEILPGVSRRCARCLSSLCFCRRVENGRFQRLEKEETRKPQSKSFIFIDFK